MQIQTVYNITGITPIGLLDIKNQLNVRVSSITFLNLTFIQSVIRRIFEHSIKSNTFFIMNGIEKFPIYLNHLKYIGLCESPEKNYYLLNQ